MIILERQKHSVRALSDNIINFNPNSFYKDSLLKEIGRTILRVDDETALSVYKQVDRRIKFSSFTALGSWAAGTAVAFSGFGLVVKDHSDFAGFAIEIAGGILLSLGNNVRSDAVRMKDNLKRVIIEARKQHQESKKDSI